MGDFSNGGAREGGKVGSEGGGSGLNGSERKLAKDNRRLGVLFCPGDCDDCLGEGKPLFTDINQRVNLQMVGTKKFSSGVVQLIYRLNRN